MASRLKLPHAFVLLLAGVAVAIAMTWILPAGEYQRRTDAASGRSVVVPGTYARVEPAPVGLMPGIMAVPRGIVAGADVILVVLFVGGVFGLLDATGALGRLVGSLVGLASQPRIVVGVICPAFASLGALENMHEEIVAMIPVLLVLSRGLGFGAITALAMSVGSAVVGSAFGPTNPFCTGIALRFAELDALSQPALRFGMFGAAVVIWIAWTLAMTSRDNVRPEVTHVSAEPETSRGSVVLAVGARDVA